MFPMKRQAIGSEFHFSLLHLCDTASLNMDKCVSITTDGTEPMTGMKIGMVTLSKECLTECGDTQK